jgi:hypothetical protein
LNLGITPSIFFTTIIPSEYGIRKMKMSFFTPANRVGYRNFECGTFGRQKDGDLPRRGSSTPPYRNHIGKVDDRTGR